MMYCLHLTFQWKDFKPDYNNNRVTAWFQGNEAESTAARWRMSLFQIGYLFRRCVDADSLHFEMSLSSFIPEALASLTVRTPSTLTNSYQVILCLVCHTIALFLGFRNECILSVSETCRMFTQRAIGGLLGNALPRLTTWYSCQKWGSTRREYGSENCLFPPQWLSSV